MPREITPQELSHLYDYSLVSGRLYRKTTRGRWLAGSRCGSRKGRGYFQVEIAGKNYLLHRVAWALVTGEWPSEHIDHIDTSSSNNAWHNLRDVPQKTNTENSRVARTHNKSGRLGVSTNAGTGKFFARIKADGVVHHLGTFEQPGQAHQAYVEAKRKLHQGNTL